jgi:putative transposase
LSFACNADNVDGMRRYRDVATETVYHITSRGNGQQAIFLDDQDRLCFLELLGKVVREMDWVCHAYGLMDNHYHLIVELNRRLNLSVGMQRLNSRYAQAFNARHRRNGHLFQDRFDSQIVDSDAYFMVAASYIVLNPVSACIVGSPASWLWSSYAQTAEGVAIVDFLETRRLLSLFAEDLDEARLQYKEFINEWLQALREDKNLKPGDAPAELIRPVRPSLPDIFAEPNGNRNELIEKAYFGHGYKLREIAAFLDLSTSGVSKIINSCKAKVERKVESD